MVSWQVYIAIGILIWTGIDLISKKVLKDMDTLIFAWVYNLFAVITYSLVVIQIPSQINWSELAVFATVASGIFNSLAFLLTRHSIKISPVSKVVPLSNFGPIFTVALAIFLLGENPGFKAVIGALLIVGGAYILNLEKYSVEHVLLPLKSLLTDQGTLLMLIGSFVYSLCAIFDKVAVTSIPVIYYTYLLYLIIFLCLTFFIYLRRIKARDIEYEMSKNVVGCVGVGILAASASFVHFSALSMAEVSIVQPLKWTYTLLTVVFGYLIFREGHLKERLFGAVIMVLGTFLILGS